MQKKQKTSLTAFDLKKKSVLQLLLAIELQKLFMTDTELTRDNECGKIANVTTTNQRNLVL